MHVTDLGRVLTVMAESLAKRVGRWPGNRNAEVFIGIGEMLRAGAATCAEIAAEEIAGRDDIAERVARTDAMLKATST